MGNQSSTNTTHPQQQQAHHHSSQQQQQQQNQGHQGQQGHHHQQPPGIVVTQPNFQGTTPFGNSAPHGSAPPHSSLHNRNRTTSDTSMSGMEESDERRPGSANLNNSGSGGGAGAGGGKHTFDIASFSAAEDDTVPTVFRWEHGGRQVYITGTFNGWSRQIPMHRSGNDFTYIHNLKRGKHAFKFIVDDEWRFAPDQPTVADIDGRINNFIDVTDFKAYTGDKDFEREKAAAEYGCYYANNNNQNQKNNSGIGAVVEGAETTEEGKDGSTGEGRPDPDGEVFSQNMPDLDEYNKEPPPLPPHLRHIILNKPPQLQDTAALPVPQHVALNHLYCTAIKDNMMVLGITQRFKTKFVTTVYYSPCAS